MTETVFPRKNATALLVVDVQERLLAAMPADRAETLVKAHLALLEMARVYNVPVVVTEQYPKGLGPTVGAVHDALGEHRRIEKVEFSACANEAFRDEVLGSLPDDVIVTGMETHVCVLQTALDLVASGRRVFVPHDATCSRTERNHENGLSLAERGGAVVINTESLVFAQLGRAGGDAFKRLSRLVK
jgi:nicotinamidase-related amidase